MRAKGIDAGRTTDARRRWRRGVAAAAGLGGPALVLVLLASVVTANTAVTKVIVAPYKGVHAILKDTSTPTGCGGGAHGTKSYFNVTSGVGGFVDNGSTKWCTTSTNNSIVEEGSFTVAFPIHVKANGTYSIAALWLTQAYGSVNLSAGTCTASPTAYYSGCTRSAATFVYGSAFLLDKTTGIHTKLSNKWPGNSTYISNYTSCIYRGCTSTGKKTTGSLHTGAAYWAWYWNGTVLNTTHIYTLKMTVFGGVSLLLYTSGGASLTGASADGQLNTGTTATSTST